MIKDLADNLMTEGKQHVSQGRDREEALQARRLHQGQAALQDVPFHRRRAESSAGLLGGGRAQPPRPSGVAMSWLLRWCAASRRPAMVRRRDVPRRPAMVCDGTR